MKKILIYFIIILFIFLSFACDHLFLNNNSSNKTIYTSAIYVNQVQSNISEISSTIHNNLNSALTEIIESAESSPVDVEYSIVFSGLLEESNISIDYSGEKKLSITISGISSGATISAQKLSSVLRISGENLKLVLGEKLTLTNGLSEEGGGIHVLGSTLEVDGATIAGNVAYFAGGGIYVKNGTFKMLKGLITQNIATGKGESFPGADDSFIGHGGGVYLTGSKTSVYDNEKNEFIISDTFSSLYLEGGRIENNTATSQYGGGSGGGVYLHHNVDAKKTNAVIIQNNNATYEKDICEFYSSFSLVAS